MRVKPSTDVYVLIFEDDRHYNDLLADKIRRLNGSPWLYGKNRVKVRQVYHPDAYFAEPMRGRAGQTIAFVDYYLGDGHTGVSVSDRLLAQDDSIRIVILSRSAKAIRSVGKLKLNNALYTKLVKHEYTPDICGVIVENCIQNL